MSASTAREMRRLKGRKIVYAFALVAGMSVVVSPAWAQFPELQLTSRLLPENSANDGLGDSVSAGMLDPAVAAFPVGMSVGVSSWSSSSKPAMIAAAQPFTPASEICSDQVPASYLEAGTSNLPNAPSAYVPLSSHCKFQLFIRRAYSPYTFYSAAFEAGIAQMSSQWPQYGGGMQGWGKRFGATLADTESRRFIQTYLFATLLHQDPRYFPSTKTGVVARAWYAATRVLVTRGDNGQSQFNLSEMLGAFSTSALQNTYYPQHYRTLNDTVSRFTGALSSDATSAILREFTPDLKRLFNKHCPRKLKTLEAKLPIPEEDKP